MRLWALLSLLGALEVAGEPAGALAVHPLVVEEASPEEAGLLDVWFAEKVDGMKQVVSRVRVESVLASEAGDRCVGEPSPCLGRVATKVGATRAAMVTVRLYPVVAVGQVVGADGKLLAAPVVKQKSAPRATRLDSAKAAIEEVLRELPLDDPRPLAAAVQDPPAKGLSAPPSEGYPLTDAPREKLSAESAEHPLAETPTGKPSATSAGHPRTDTPPGNSSAASAEHPGVAWESPWRKRAGYGLGAVAVLSAVGGATLGVQGLAAAGRFEDQVKQGGREAIGLRDLQVEAASKQTAGLCLLGAALASGAVGGFLVLAPGSRGGLGAELTTSPLGPVLVGTFP